VDYEPPLDYAEHLREVIDGIDSQSVKGLSLVLLRNSGSVRRREVQWKKPGGVSPRDVQGVYYRAWKEPARIELMRDNILEEWPGWATKAPILRYHIVTRVFFHELSHHMHALENPKAPSDEAKAVREGKQMSGQYFRQRYPWLIPPLRLIWWTGQSFISLGKRLGRLLGSTRDR
jgi:hypothetical protein